jgi:branched-subunit amino acid ABC-type transport system permease component
MSEYLPFVVIGLFTGAVYALAAAGLVLTYKTSGVFNFGHGAIGMFAAYVFYHLNTAWGWGTIPSMAVALLLFGPLMGVLLDRVLFRSLAGAGLASYVVASLGLLVFLQGLAVRWKGGNTYRINPFFPTNTFKVPGVSGVFVTVEQALVVAIAVLAGVALTAFFRVTKLGLRTRAVVNDRDLTSLVGVSPNVVTTLSWALGCFFASLSAILFVPSLGLDSVLLTLLVLTALGAAAAGRLTSIPVTMVTAFAIGVGQSLLVKAIGTRPSLAGLPTSLPFVVLFVILFFAKKTTFALPARAQERIAKATARRGGRSHRSRFPARQLLVLSAVAVLLPATVSGYRLSTATTAVAMVLVFSSLSLLLGLSRQVSLCHAMFVSFGATNLSLLLHAHVPFLPALILAALLVVPLGAIVAIPSIRLSGLFLALATFGFGKLAQDVLYPTALAFGSDSLASVPRPAAFRGPMAFYYLVLAIAIVGVVVVEVLKASRLGRTLRALADSPTAVESLGISPSASRVIVFCVSAFLAGLAGGLLGTLVQSINPNSFDFFLSLLWVTVLVVAGASTLGGSVLAAILLVVVPAILTSRAVTEWQPVAFGLAAMAFAQLPNGIMTMARMPDWSAAWQRVSWKAAHQHRAEERHAVTAPARAS